MDIRCEVIQSNIPEDTILHSHLRENLKSYVVKSTIQISIRNVSICLVYSSRNLSSGKFLPALKVENSLPTLIQFLENAKS
jgi:hypothetical protein